MVSQTQLTVRYAETDRMGIVHHSRYFPWFEVARNDFIKASGVSYRQMEEMGVWLPLSESGAKYIMGLEYEDEVMIKTKLKRLTVARCVFEYEVYKKDTMKLACTGMTMHGITDPNLKPINLKKAFPNVWDLLVNMVEI